MTSDTFDFSSLSIDLILLQHSVGGLSCFLLHGATVDSVNVVRFVHLTVFMPLLIST